MFSFPLTTKGEENNNMMIEEHDDSRSKHNMMTRGGRNMLDSRIVDSDSDESRRKLEITETLEKEHPFPLMPKGERREA